MSSPKSFNEINSSPRRQTTDEDSDPEFVNNAPYTYEREEKKRNKRDTLNLRRKSSKANGKGASQNSPSFLDMFFGPILVDNTQTKNEDTSETESEENDDLSEGYSTSGYKEKSSSVQRGSSDPRSISQPKRHTSCSSLVTGPDSDNAFDFSSQKISQKSSSPFDTSAINRSQYSSQSISHTTSQGEESVTESDSGEEDFLNFFSSQDNQKAVNSLTKSITENIKKTKSESQPQNKESESETESDDDYETEDPFILNPRPAFNRDKKSVQESYLLDEDTKTYIPGPINGFLRQYQRDGVQFFYDRYKEGRGGVLGDDMGLGKTVQVIAFLSSIMKKYNDRRDMNRRYKHVSKLQDGHEWRKRRCLPPANATWPTCLIIAPSSVVPNWERELSTWGYFEVGMYVGSKTERKEALKNFKMGRLDVLITSFDLARRDKEDLFDLPFSVVFVDEAHRLKNPTSNLTLLFNEIACEVRFGLTGTAIQNSYDELWTLLDWSNPGRLGSLKEWRTCISKPLAVGQSAKANKHERAMSKAVARILVDQLLPKVFLRRTKDLIKDQLPQKIDQVVFCPLTPQQLRVYRRILDYKEKCMRLTGKRKKSSDASICDCGSGLARSSCCHAMEDAHFFTYLTVLLKVSNHLALIFPDPNDTQEQIKRNREVAKIAFDDYKSIRYGAASLSSNYCGKWDVLDTLLSRWKKEKDNKVLIFTKSVKLLNILDFHLQKNSYNFCRLDGSTKLSERMPLIDKFNQNPDVFVFLISTMAGGTGLNLTSANKVVIFDPNWNPAHDLQAMDRAYRFGQTRDVHVYRLLGAGSIEENIYARQIYKQQMMKIGYEASHQTRYFEGVQGDSKRKGELFGLDNLFTLQEDELTTKVAIEKANLAEFDWAMANMESGSRRNRKKSEQSKEAQRLEAEADKELRGLVTLFLDKGAPSVKDTGASDDISNILGTGAIMYSHQNEDLLRPSRVEEMSLQEAMKNIKKRKTSTSPPKEAKRRRKNEPVDEPASSEVDTNWPPRRGNYKPPLSPTSREKARKKALVDLGYIKADIDYSQFANTFTAMPPDKQQAILRKLDQHIRST